MPSTTFRFSPFARFVGVRGGRTLFATSFALSVFALAPEAFARAERRNACPSNMAHVGNGCVDKWEASLVEVLPSGSEAPFSPYTPPNGHRVKAVSRPGVIPQAHISMVEAQRACKASGKRLCHSKEWKNACKGPGNTRYPYGDKHVAHACVDTNRTSPMRALGHGAFNHSNMNDPRLNQLTNTVEPTGAIASCTNSYDVHDMVGNVHEWVDDGAFHGGYYLDTKINNEGCDYKTTAHAPNYYDYSTGFRCCADEGTLPSDQDEENGTEPLDGVARVDSVRPAPRAELTVPVRRPSDFGHSGGEHGDAPVFAAEAVSEISTRDSMYPPA